MVLRSRLVFLGHSLDKMRFAVTAFRQLST